jgi:hypothetical protein
MQSCRCPRRLLNRKGKLHCHVVHCQFVQRPLIYSNIVLCHPCDNAMNMTPLIVCSLHVRPPARPLRGSRCFLFCRLAILPHRQLHVLRTHPPAAANWTDRRSSTSIRDMQAAGRQAGMQAGRQELTPAPHWRP